MYDIPQRQKSIISKMENELKTVSNGFQNQVMAVVLYKNREISKAVNIRKTDTFQHMFAKNEHAIYIHAETLAIKRAIRLIGKEKLKDCELIVMRLAKTMSKHGKSIVKTDFASSSPCEGCLECINHHGIKKVIHTIEGGFSKLN